MSNVDTATIGEILGETITDNGPTPLANEKATMLGVVITSLIVCWACVLFRLHTRLSVVHSAGWDDLLVLLALLTTTVGAIAMILCELSTLSSPVRFRLSAKAYASVQLPRAAYLANTCWILHFRSYNTTLMLFYIMDGVYATSTALIKLSLLFQYLRIFKKGALLYRVCQALVAITSVWGLISAIFAWYPCTRIEDFWLLPADAHCWGFGAGNSDEFVSTFEGQAGINMILDLLILAIAMRLYLVKDAPARMKIGLLGLLVMGILVNLFSVWRLITLVQHKAATYPAYDPTWYAPISLLLADLEVNMAIACASVPVFWPVLEHRFSKIFITQEIDITHEDRWLPSYGEQAELTDMHARNPHGRGNSDPELSKFESTVVVGSSRENHYDDEFIMGQVDPIRQAKHSVVRATANTGDTGQGRKWWRL